MFSELVDFCVEMYNTAPNITIALKLINILNITIRNGSKQSMVVLNLKNRYN